MAQQMLAFYSSNLGHSSVVLSLVVMVNFFLDKQGWLEGEGLASLPVQHTNPKLVERVEARVATALAVGGAGNHPENLFPHGAVQDRVKVGHFTVKSADMEPPRDFVDGDAVADSDGHDQVGRDQLEQRPRVADALVGTDASRDLRREQFADGLDDEDFDHFLVHSIFFG